MKKSTKNIISIAAVLIIIAAFWIPIATLGLTPSLGLDLKGGVSLVFEAQGKTIDSGKLDKAVEKIRSRVDRLGVSEPEITTQGGRDIAVQLPGIKDVERAKQIVGQTAQLQFRIVSAQKAEADIQKDPKLKDDPAWKVSTGDQLKPNQPIVLPLTEDKEKQILQLSETKMSGDSIKSARVEVDNTSGNSKITFKLTPAGTKTFADLTTANVNKRLAIVLDYNVESAPTIQQAITDGSGEITGTFTDKEANNISIVLNTGALPLELKLINEQVVTATLGRDSLNKGLLAGLVGLAIVALFLILFYHALGLVACMSLGVFGLLLLGLITALGSTYSITLAGVAGIIVSIGIAADSSIVYFERLKEEVAQGRTLRATAERSYKSAFRTIIAADTVSFGAAAILWVFAIGSVRGFAFTLGLATLFDVFTSYFFTRPLVGLLANWEAMGRPGWMGIRLTRDKPARGEAS
jgi:preprotein translocase subunit SecD